MGRPLSNLKAGRHAWLLLVLAWYAVSRVARRTCSRNRGFESGNSGRGPAGRPVGPRTGQGLLLARPDRLPRWPPVLEG